MESLERGSSQVIPRSVKLAILGTVCLLFVSLSSYAVITWESGNLHEVVPGQVFRSAQLSRPQLEACISRYGVKSVLNLRGKNVGKVWYKEETELCGRHGIAHFDIALSSSKDVLPEQAEEIIATFKAAPKPLLIHCRDGADRTGFAAALYLWAVSRVPAEDAANQLTMWYGHIPFVQWWTQAMDRSYWQYVRASNH